MRKIVVVALEGASVAAVPVEDVSAGVALLEKIKADGGMYKGKRYHSGVALSTSYPHFHKRRVFPDAEAPAQPEGGEG